MAFRGGADKVVISELELAGKCFPGRREIVAVLLWLLSFGDRGLLHFLAVFVQAGEKKDLLAEAASGAGAHIRDDFLIGMAEGWMSIDVIDGGGDVETFAHPGLHWAKAETLKSEILAKKL